MLPYSHSTSHVTYPAYVQPKLNGVRALYQVGHFQLCDETSPTLSHLTEPLSKIFDERIILDGALYVHGWSPEQIDDAVKAEAGEVEYHVFDVVNFNRSFESRFMAPASILIDTQHIHKTKPVETHRLLSAKLVTYFYDKWVSGGYDGLIYRLNGCPYVPGRSRNLLYRKK
jgi:hypothetical protein